jgi:Transposase DDE domain
VHGSGYERIASPGCSDRTIRRRLKTWAAAGIGAQVHALALAAYDQMIGLELGDVAVDGCITKAPCGGQRAGPSPVDRRKGGLKRSVATEDYGIPLGIACAGASRHDSPLLVPTLHATANQLGGVLPDQRACRLDAGYDSGVTRQALSELGFTGQIAHKGAPAPIQAGRRWPVERTHSWMNGYGKLRRMTDRDAAIVEFYLYLAAAFVTVRALIQHARRATAGTPAPPPSASNDTYCRALLVQAARAICWRLPETKTPRPGVWPSDLGFGAAGA